MTAADELSPAGSNTPPISPPRPLSGDRDDLSDMSDSTPSPSALPDQQHPPSFRSSSDYSTTTMNPSSTPLGQLNAARRPGGPISTRSSGLNEDTMAKMKAFSLSRQGAPAPHQNPQMPPHTTSTGDVPTTSSPIPNAKFPGAVAVSQERKPAGNVSLAGGVCGRGLAGANTPGQAPASSPKMGGLAAKRGLKKGMKLSDVAGGPPPSAPGNNNGQASDKEGSSESSAGKDEAGKDAASQGNPTDSLFSKYSEFIDTQAGTLNFKNKAIIHGGGIEFTSGGSFKISLDEVDTLDELGKGNYGTVWKVRHSRPHLRKPGQGLRGIMARRGSISHTGTDGGSHSRSNSPSAGQDLSGAIMAMKEIRLELDESKFTAIIMELDILHRCVSPFIIDFYGAFFQEGAVYICVEYMDGGSIDKLYAGGIPEDILQKVILSTIMGLKSLKDDHNIIHRDVKPTNILVNTRGQIKICDFGVSGNLVASIAKTNIGCQSYMAPERIAGGGMSQSGDASGGTYGVHSDIWSLGLTIIECAIGRYPYPPDTFNNIFSQLNAIVHGDPPTLPDETFSQEAHNFVRSCLNKNAKLRPNYGMLLRHPWLAPLLERPTPGMVEEDDTDSSDLDEEDDERSGRKFISSSQPSTSRRHVETADKAVAEWVTNALERKHKGTNESKEKPALHAVPLDAVPGSPLLDDPKTISPSQK